MWMAENLNYADEEKYPSMIGKNWCYDDNPQNCDVYGRLYSWSAAIDSVYMEKQGVTCGYLEKPCDLPNQTLGICPIGWHIPNSTEWNILYESVENNYKALQSQNVEKWKRATDAYAFSVLPAGYKGFPGDFFSGQQNSDEGDTHFWSSDEYDESFAYEFGVGANGAGVSFAYKPSAFSVRCIKDEE